MDHPHKVNLDIIFTFVYLKQSHTKQIIRGAEYCFNKNSFQNSGIVGLSIVVVAGGYRHVEFFL